MAKAPTNTTMPIRDPTTSTTTYFGETRSQPVSGTARQARLVWIASLGVGVVADLRHARALGLFTAPRAGRGKGADVPPPRARRPAGDRPRSPGEHETKNRQSSRQAARSSRGGTRRYRPPRPHRAPRRSDCTPSRAPDRRIARERVDPCLVALPSTACRTGHANPTSTSPIRPADHQVSVWAATAGGPDGVQGHLHEQADRQSDNEVATPASVPSEHFNADAPRRQGRRGCCFIGLHDERLGRELPHPVGTSERRSATALGPGSTASGSTCSHGCNTNARSQARGCGSVSRSLSRPARRRPSIRSRSRVRSPQTRRRTRP